MDQQQHEQYDTFTLPASGEDIEDEKQPIEVTDAGDGKRQLVGYAVVWGAVSDVRRDGFRHRFSRGSIKWTDTVNALWSHDYATPLASTANNTLTIAEDDFGAKVTIDLDDTTDGQNTFTRVKNKLVSGMSFGGKRLAYDRTTDPKVIDVTSFVADEISITIQPGMDETAVVTSDNHKQLEQKKIAAAVKMQRATLDKSKLTMLTGGRVSTGLQAANRK